jgi:hypothetical protein
MGLVDAVAGLELHAVMGKYGVYLKCDCCGVTLDAPRVDVGTDGERISADEAALRALARSRGWTGALDRSNQGSDACPACSKTHA